MVASGACANAAECRTIALWQGLDRLITIETGMPVHIAENPLDCVAMGAGKILEINYAHNEAVSDPA